MNHDNYDITIGHDTEVFLWSPTYQNYVSAVGLIGGSKQMPRPCDGGALQEDNIMAELNIIPARTSEEFVGNTAKVFTELTKTITPLGLEYRITPSIQINPQYIDPMESTEFGCDIDYSAYTMCPNRINFEELILNNYRTAGGHIHIGIFDTQIGMCPIYDQNKLQFRLAQLCDVYLGLYSVLYDTDIIRQQYYGIPGSMRFKDYGIEYRTMSNWWISSPETQALVFDGAIKATVTLLNELEHGEELVSKDIIKESRGAILSKDKSSAIQLRQECIKIAA